MDFTGLSTLSGGTPAAGSNPTGTSLAGLSSPLYIPSGTNLQATQPPPTTYYNPDGSAAASQKAAQDAAATSAFYNGLIGQLQGQYGNLDNQQNVGLSNIGNSYNNSANRLNQQKGYAQQDYTDQTNTNDKTYSNNRAHIAQNTNSQAQALQRLLGINGSGNSSAAYEQAPYAAGLQGTQQLNDAQQTYGLNGINLDKSWQRTLDQYTNNFNDLNNQRYAQENGLKQSIAQTRADLLGKIGSAQSNVALANGGSYQQAMAAQQPYQDQVNSLLGQITNLGNQYANPVVRTGDINYQTPALSQYLLNQGVKPIDQNTGAGTSAIDPTFAPILDQKRDQFGNVIA